MSFNLVSEAFLRVVLLGKTEETRCAWLSEAVIQGKIRDRLEIFRATIVKLRT
jgi:hypothetical protein